MPPTWESLAGRIIAVPGWKQILPLDQVLDRLLRGETALLVDGYEGALLLTTRKKEGRNPEAPDNEPAVRGPQDGFVENLAINRSLIRRRLINPALRFDTITVGRDTRTEINVAYLQGLPPAELLGEVRRRLQAIDTAAILDAGMISGWIEDSPLSPIPQINSTSRPDKAAAAILEGRVVLVVSQCHQAAATGGDLHLHYPPVPLGDADRLSSGAPAHRSGPLHRQRTGASAGARAD